jgi:hypothetical protein
VLQTHYLDLGYGLEPMDAAVHNDAPLLPETFLLQDMWMFGITKSTSELTAVACPSSSQRHGGRQEILPSITLWAASVASTHSMPYPRGRNE